MRCTRGEIVRRFRLLTGWRLAAPTAGFLVVALCAAVWFVCLVSPLTVAGVAGLVEVVSAWLGRELTPDCFGSAEAASAEKRRTLKNPQQSAVAASTHHFIEPDRTTLVFREDTLLPEPAAKSSGGNSYP